MHATMEPNAPYLEAVAGRISDAIVAFCRKRVGQEFHADDLRRFVSVATGTNAPASSDRVLRDLRQRGVIVYTVVNRAKSLYRVDKVRHETD